MGKDRFPTERMTLSDAADYVGIAANIALAMVCPFVRSRTGKRYPGGYALIAGFVILYLAGERRDQLVMIFFYGWLALLAIRRVQTFVRANGEHTQFRGYPLLYRRLGRGAYLLEPAWVFMIGAMLRPYSAGLHLIWISAAAGMLYLEVVHRMLQRQRIDAMADAGIEAEQRASMTRYR